MIKEIKMPNLGTTTNEMTLVKWHKKENDRIKRGEILFEVETDKAVMDVESYLDGYIKKIMISEDETVSEGMTVAYVGDENDSLEEPGNTGPAKEKEQENTDPAKETPAAVRISPMVKKIAEKLGVDYSQIQGTGAGGMITKEDIEKAAGGTGAESGSGTTDGVVKFSRIAEATARAMKTSKTTIPHVYFTIEVDTSAMIRSREESNKTISYNAMIIKAVADCLIQFPYLASRYTDSGRVLADKINIGLAVARGEDLLVPVVEDAAGAASLLEIERRLQELVNKVREDRLQQKDISGGVFTVTNLGGSGIDSFSAVINPPEAAILAVGRIARKVVPADDEIRIVPMMNMTLSVDHRIVNGAYAAEFLQKLKLTLESMQ